MHKTNEQRKRKKKPLFQTQKDQNFYSPFNFPTLRTTESGAAVSSEFRLGEGAGISETLLLRPGGRGGSPEPLSAGVGGGGAGGR